MAAHKLGGGLGGGHVADVMQGGLGGQRIPEAVGCQHEAAAPNWQRHLPHLRLSCHHRTRLRDACITHVSTHTCTQGRGMLQTITRMPSLSSEKQKPPNAHSPLKTVGLRRPSKAGGTKSPTPAWQPRPTCPLQKYAHALPGACYAEPLQDIGPKAKHRTITRALPLTVAHRDASHPE